MQFYSWKDVERFCLLNKHLWEDSFDQIEVYPDEITVYTKGSRSRPSKQVLANLFGSHYDAEDSKVKLDIGEAAILVYEEQSESHSEKAVLPLFRNILYHTASYPAQGLLPLQKPVIAFHSYKGGVGRTLSLIAFAKAWSTALADTPNAKLLIVDADIEAPGLTWLQDKQFGGDGLSYLDLLTLIQDHTDERQIIELACSKLKTSTLTIETETRTVEYVFLPTYRYEEQLLDLYATPESIVNGRNKEYIFARVLAGICERMGLAAAIVDLRAGISEYSSTLLLDPRVKKYLVSSTSTQSIKGTQILLKYLMRGLVIQEDTILPEVFLNMIPDTLPNQEKGEILSNLYQYYEDDQASNGDNHFTDNVITELPFASELIHLTSMKQILANLDGRSMYLKLQELVRQNYRVDTSLGSQLTNGINRERQLEQINKLAETQLTAEGNGKFDILMTAPLKHLGKKFSETVPVTVIMGAKGSGKTFLYRKMAESVSWDCFCSNLFGPDTSSVGGYFLPVIATRNSSELTNTLKECIRRLNENIPCSYANESVFLNNARKLEQEKSKKPDWFVFWERLLTSSINPNWNSFQEANTALEKDGKKVVFLIDGLEDIFIHVSRVEDEQQAIRILCQDIVNQIKAQYYNLGIIIFLRRDMASASIPVNYKQFEQTYKDAELKWSSNEALRLAVWLVAQADKEFYKGPKEIDLASQKVIDENLIRLWGLKLGKASSNEAYSSRWILAALSDFNGQLQARDIIRFLQYATVPNGKKAPYDDRILMPVEIKNAVATCSVEKMNEAKQEYAALKPIFEKLEQLSPEEKVLPLNPEHAKLNNDEEKIMVSEGYLKRDGEKFYLPEIARHALGFRYSKGARPKVLSLTLQH